MFSLCKESPFKIKDVWFKFLSVERKNLFNFSFYTAEKNKFYNTNNPDINIKYTHKDGREAIYVKSTGKLLKLKDDSDVNNKGSKYGPTFNYSSDGILQPGHFYFDMITFLHCFKFNNGNSKVQVMYDFSCTLLALLFLIINLNFLYKILYY